jgi:hypothetical protein
MPAPRRPAPYHAWLLRCWQEPGATAPDGGWRFSLEDPHTGVRRGFGDLAALLAFLEGTLGGAAPDAGAGGPPGLRRGSPGRRRRRSP